MRLKTNSVNETMLYQYSLLDTSLYCVTFNEIMTSDR